MENIKLPLKNIEWKEEHETILIDWADKAMCYRWLHSKANTMYSVRNAWFTIPVIIISTVTGTANEIETSAASQTITIGLPNNVTIGNDLTVTGDLIVNGDQTIVNTANLAVEDKFILINSGSATQSHESGIIFGGSNGSANNGAALVWEGDYNSNDGRIGIANSVNADATSATINYHLAGVFSGNDADSQSAQADHPGNIRIDGSDIYIYV